MKLRAEQTIVAGGSNDAHERLIGEFIERSVFQPDFGLKDMAAREAVTGDGALAAAPT